MDDGGANASHSGSDEIGGGNKRGIRAGFVCSNLNCHEMMGNGTEKGDLAFRFPEMKPLLGMKR